MKKLLITIALLTGFLANAQDVDRSKLLRDIETLSSDKYAGRKTGTDGNNAAAEYISGRFKETGLRSFQDKFRHPFSFKNRKSEPINGTNLIGFVKGKTDDVIVISAHYDHVGVNNSQIYNGADDNASGVSVLLGIAEYFKDHKPRNTLLFIAFDAEEMGLQGAYAFIKEPLPSRNSIILNVNMDMVSHNDKSELYASGTYKTPVLKEIIKGADENTGINILFGHDIPGSGKDDWTMQSDQGPFAKENIPFIYFGVEDHDDYHKPTDIFANINQDFFHSASIAILRSIIKLDKDLNKIKANTADSLKTK
ncbi:Peptidase family M28 [Daejeonella rubra]|uniref:Peptidase family M28 n=1 Tax=Daejeonella rubra TaxID=990371 RepID=A0A1G9S6S2_9SPHI|nr:M28 family peptidase [Daejeonella rubra]SDM31209.1 Peptidase family M28 [Daejeonella rubra]